MRNSVCLGFLKIKLQCSYALCKVFPLFYCFYKHQASTSTMDNSPIMVQE
uniref:Uncharacterized protein n=1 Tax=Rhizophora mucronata TaxID=61149 RepID=A0A2P2QJC0_RHIMU